MLTVCTGCVCTTVLSYLQLVTVFNIWSFYFGSLIFMDNFTCYFML